MFPSAPSLQSLRLLYLFIVSTNKKPDLLYNCCLFQTQCSHLLSSVFIISLEKILRLVKLKYTLNELHLKKKLLPKSLKSYCVGVQKGIPQVQLQKFYTKLKKMIEVFVDSLIKRFSFKYFISSIQGTLAATQVFYITMEAAPSWNNRQNFKWHSFVWTPFINLLTFSALYIYFFQNVLPASTLFTFLSRIIIKPKR